MANLHLHPCLHAPRCTNRVECGGEQSRNHDGCPETVCDLYHRPYGEVDPVPCGECEEATCVVCGINTRFEEHAESCSQHPENRDYEEAPADSWAMPFARNH